MRKFYLFFFSVLFSLPSTYAQISYGGTPYSFRHDQLETHIQEITLPSIDVQSLQLEDSIRTLQKLPFRFGQEWEVDLNLDKDGTWHTLANGDLIWRLSLTCPGAHSINLIYDDFFLPAGANLFLYSADRQSLLGGFTSRNNKVYQSFSTGLVWGETTILEYYEPAKVAGQGRISIKTVVHGYRGFDLASNRDFNDSGPCNNNVNCPEGADWQDEVRSVAMILSGGFRLCTGVMINNARENCRPYFLTANHCLIGNVNNWMFMYNYESPDCSNIDGPTNMTVSGATLLSSGQNSDFALLELSSAPPLAYNVFYAGFSADTVAADTTVCIHHPAGDIKKISFNHDTVLSANWFFNADDTHWEVDNWEDGTTEGGSSGSPLFDKHHRIVGQLHGGPASCTTIDYDRYGKFSYSWAPAASPASQLKFWLDPDDTGILVKDGKDCGVVPAYLDAAITDFLFPTERITCEDTVAAEVRIQNFGLPIASFELRYRWDTGPWQPLSITDSVNYLDTRNIAIPATALELGQHQLEVAIHQVNGSQDSLQLNDSLLYQIEVIEGRGFMVELRTDGFPEETSFEILDTANQVLYAASAFDSSNHTYTLPYCLEPGCYTIVLRDAFGDGMNVQTAIKVIGPDGNLLTSVPGSFVSELSASFCIPFWEPVAQITPADTVICAGKSVQFASVGPYTDSVSWAFAGGIPTLSSDSAVSVSYDTPGLYDVFFTAVGPGGQDNFVGAQLVEVVPSPVTGVSLFNASSPTAADGFATANVQGGVAPYTYTWSTGQAGMDSMLNNLSPGTYSVYVEDAIGCLDTAEFWIGPNVGIADELLKASIQIFPNPGLGVFSLQRTQTQEVLQIRVLNSLGQMIEESLEMEQGRERIQINLSDHPSGVYVVQVQSDKALVQLRVLKL